MNSNFSSLIGETVELQQVDTEEANLGQETLPIDPVSGENVDILKMIQEHAGTNELDRILPADNGHVKIVTLRADTLAGGEGARGGESVTLGATSDDLFDWLLWIDHTLESQVRREGNLRPCWIWGFLLE